MWISDIEKALEKVKIAFDKNYVLIESIAPSYDGIVIKLSNGKSVMWAFADEKLYLLPSWKSDDKPTLIT